MSRNRPETFEYDIALSFAGEDRECAEQIAMILKRHDVSVFYDKHEQADLWGKNLYDHLADVYSRKAQYCIMFLSKNYAEKAWTKLERQNAQARAFQEHSEYILPVRLDDTVIPGIAETVYYLDLKDMSLEEIAEATLKKLGKTTVEVSAPQKRTSDIPMPRIKGKITQRDKDRFVHEAYNCIKDYFQEGLKLLAKQDSRVEGDIQEINQTGFIAKAYIQGIRKNKCKIWIGGMIEENSISFVENYSDYDSNCINDWLSVEEHDGNLVLKGGFNTAEEIDELLSTKQAAKYFWKRFIEPLEH